MNNSRALDYLAQGEKKFLSINSLSSDSNIFVTDNSNNNHRISTHNRDKKFENLEKNGIKHTFKNNMNKFFGNKKKNLFEKYRSNKKIPYLSNTETYTFLNKSSREIKIHSSMISNLHNSLYSNQSESKEKISSNFEYSFGKYLNIKSNN